MESVTGWIEIFKAGEWNGIKWTKKKIDNVAKNFKGYNPDNMDYAVPAIIGHTSDDRPGAAAYAFVKELKAEAGRLYAKFIDTSGSFIDGLGKKLFPKRSVEIGYKSEMLYAVAFDSVFIPAVKGMSYQFKEHDDNESIDYEETNLNEEDSNMEDLVKMQADISAKTTEISRLSEENKTLMSERDTLKSESEKLQAANGELITKLSEAEKNIEAHRTEKRKTALETVRKKVATPHWQKFEERALKMSDEDFTETITERMAAQDYVDGGQHAQDLNVDGNKISDDIRYSEADPRIIKFAESKGWKGSLNVSQLKEAQTAVALSESNFKNEEED